MTKFDVVKFGDLYAEPVRNGLTRPTRVRGSGYRMVNMGELFAYDRLNGQPMELVPLNARELRVATLEIGDLLFARSSLKIEGTGKCSIVVGLPDTTTFESHLIRARLDRDCADSRFYFYFFQSYLGRATVLSIAKQVGAAGLPGSQLAGLNVPRPAIDVQRRIADILWQYDDLIENNRRRIQLLEQAARLLYKEWFVHLRFPGHEHVTITDGVPEGWQNRNLFDIATATYGFAFKSKFFNTDGDGLPVARIRDIPAGRSETYTTEEAPEEKLLEDGDFVIGMDGDFHMNFWTGGKTWINQRVVRIRGLADISDAFLKYALEKPIKDFEATIVGTTVAHLGAKHLKLIEVMIPTRGILQVAQTCFSSIQRQIVALKNQVQFAKVARDLLLPRLMNGEVAV